MLISGIQILNDCYGQRTLLNEGSPASLRLLYSQPNFNRFLPPVKGDGMILTSYAVDVARCRLMAHGRLWRTGPRRQTERVLRLRTAVILANVFPETSSKPCISFEARRLLSVAPGDHSVRPCSWRSR